MNGYELSRNFCDWAFENPDKVKPIHYAIYYFSIEHCNRLGWKDKFGLPSQMVMEAIGVKNWRTYSAGLNDLVDFGFIEMIETSKNQYSSNIVAIVKNTKAPTKALDKALSKHSTKHSQSIVSINKQETIKQINKVPTSEEFVAYGISVVQDVSIEALKLKYESWLQNDWCKEKNGKMIKIVNWKSTLNNTIPYLPKQQKEFKSNDQKLFENVMKQING
jgi:tRNA U34 5-carboxymethylaminomethyl modifying GTPase MnmE/TrmE